MYFTELFDKTVYGQLELKGGRVGVFVCSQPNEIWSHMSYKCIEE